MGDLGTLLLIWFIAWGIISYNKIKKLKLNIENSKSGIDVYCQQRFDLIPNLVEVVKAYTNYEKTVLEDITELRTQYYNTKDIKLAEQVNEQLNTIIVNIENYPVLKANEQFLSLQKILVKMENQLQAARRIYNSDVTAYNIAIQTFPRNIIAEIFGFKSEDLFEIQYEDATKSIKTEF